MESTLIGKSTRMTLPPAAGLSAHVLRERSCTSPYLAAQGTGLPFAGTSAAAAQAAVVGVRNIDLPGSPPRGAPV